MYQRFGLKQKGDLVSFESILFSAFLYKCTSCKNDGNDAGKDICPKSVDDDE